jgi:LysM repeat protein
MVPHPKLRLLALVTLLLLALTPITVAAQDSATRHTVQPGENLFRIALRYNVSVGDLAAANGITDVTRIYVGQQLIIPSASGDSGTGGTAASQAPANESQPVSVSSDQPSADGTYYVVQRGDTLKSIAAKFGLELQVLAQANRLTNPNVIYVGQRLFIPGGAGNQTVSQPTDSQSDTQPASAQPTKEQRKHVVQAGEGLSMIAAKYGVSWQAIAAANNLSNPNLIYVGMVLVIPEATSDPVTFQPIAPAAPDANGKLILVILSQQRTYAYENGQLLRSTYVSTGLPATPTVTGEYRIYVKYRAQLMSGPGYYLPNVPYVMYFFRGYGLHGTYWHSNFGRPMSHGCVNLPTDEARWFFDWAPVGTRVLVRW